MPGGDAVRLGVASDRCATRDGGIVGQPVAAQASDRTERRKRCVTVIGTHRLSCHVRLVIRRRVVSRRLRRLGSLHSWSRRRRDRPRQARYLGLRLFLVV